MTERVMIIVTGILFWLMFGAAIVGLYYAGYDNGKLAAMVEMREGGAK